MTYKTLPVLNLQFPDKIDGMQTKLDPREAWTNQIKYDEASRKLAQMFINNFVKFTDTKQGQSLVAFGPQL